MAGCGGGSDLISIFLKMWFELPFYDKEEIMNSWKESCKHANPKTWNKVPLKG